MCIIKNVFQRRHDFSPPPQPQAGPGCREGGGKVQEGRQGARRQPQSLRVLQESDNLSTLYLDSVAIYRHSFIKFIFYYLLLDKIL